MVSPALELLNTDPGQIALGDKARAEAAAHNPDADSAACQAALSSFRSALLFKNVFAGIVAVLAVLTVVALGFCLYKAFNTSWESATTFAAITGAVTGGGAIFLQTEKSKAQKVLENSLADVKTYCGSGVSQKLA